MVKYCLIKTSPSFSTKSSFGTPLEVKKKQKSTGGAFRTLSNIYDGSFSAKVVKVFSRKLYWEKSASLQMFDKVLNMSLSTIVFMFLSLPV